ncbi:haloacid dehalogenase [Gordoniibacillus kamchatkensis]|uniref:Haloacid dehalogenase n=2 Tax=Gordoniibacillus kamchatkensis TaxID=1590651 RepID=A0ABR5AIH3_9BACL|nr:haloacid dehalogenase [Paenibacillus sp. VKM B-2647]
MFDMDNTLLQSRIDFAAMKNEIYRYLVELNVLPAAFPVQEHTSSTLIAHARRLGISGSIDETMMATIARHEMLGMEGAGLEPGVEPLLSSLYRRYTLIVVTNNSHAAARKALELTNISRYFDLVVGREQMAVMKPSPAGFDYAKRQYGSIAPDEWISVGDAWIDGKASMDAGIPFVSYRTSMEAMIAKGVQPIGRIDRIGDIMEFIN